MSWHFSRALAEEYLRVNSSGGELSAQLKLSPIQSLFLHKDRMKQFSRLSRYGMTFGILEESLGEELLTWYRGDFLAKPSQQQRTGDQQQTTSGLKCTASWSKLDPNSFSPRTYQSKQSQKQQQTAVKADIELLHSPFLRRTWAQTITDPDIGFLHTPTTAANYLAPSMYKHQGCKNYIRVFGQKSPRAGQQNLSTKGTDSTAQDSDKQNEGAKRWPYEANESPRPNPIDQEWLMGWPPGWTDIKPLEMDRYQQWRQQHFSPCVTSQQKNLKKENNMTERTCEKCGVPYKRDKGYKHRDGKCISQTSEPRKKNKVDEVVNLLTTEQLRELVKKSLQ
jgi:hypothetical protein